MKIGKTNAIFGGGGGGGGVVYNFVPFVAPESFNDPSKYADYGCTVNLYEKFRAYKMTWAGADVAVEFSDEIESTSFWTSHIPAGAIIEIFETVLGVETSVLREDSGRHYFTAGSTKRYMIRRITIESTFALPEGSIWAYCFGITRLEGFSSPSLKYVFFHENTLTELRLFRDTTIEGTLRINGGITNIPVHTFIYCNNITKVITGDSVSTIDGAFYSGAFMSCIGLLEADLGTGITFIGEDTFRDCTSLNSIICRAYNPPTLAENAFNLIPTTTKLYVPNERVDAYKTADGWVEFASLIFSINDL